MKLFKLSPLFLCLFCLILISWAISYPRLTLAQSYYSTPGTPPLTNTPTPINTPTPTNTSTLTNTSTPTTAPILTDIPTPTNTLSSSVIPTTAIPTNPVGTPQNRDGNGNSNDNSKWWRVPVLVFGLLLPVLGIVAVVLFWYGRRRPKPKSPKTPLPPPRPKLPFLRLVNSPDKSFHINEPQFTIGRDPQSKLPLADESVAGLHATITVQNGVYVIQAENERALWVNGLPTVKNQLQDKARIRLGRVELEFYFSDSQGRPA